MPLKDDMLLGDLADPSKYCEPPDLANCSKEKALQFLDKMIEIRRAEEKISDWVLEKIVGTPCHLGIGQEAAAVGIADHLSSADRIFGNHRSHSHFLSMGGSPEKLFAEVLGRRSGASMGMGGSMHLYDKEIGFHGSVPIVAGTIPIAVGAALALKMDGGSDVAACFFGDGAAEEGVMHESMNFAASHQLPVLFVCENNLFSSHLDIDLRQPADRVARYADAHCIPNETIDGNDVMAVQAAAGRLISQIRETRGPGCIEPVTYRHRGHVGPNEDIDVGVHRTMSDVRAWKKRDPIERFEAAMLKEELVDQESIERVHEVVVERIEHAAAAALADPYPDSEQLSAFVYAAGDQT